MRKKMLIVVMCTLLLLPSMYFASSYAETKSKAIKVIAGNNCSYALFKDGSLYSWGDNSLGQLGDGTKIDRSKPIKILSNVKDIYYDKLPYSNNTVVFAIKTDKTLWGWGDNTYGRLGDGTKTARLKPIKLMSNVEKIKFGFTKVYLIKSDKTLWIWGEDYLYWEPKNWEKNMYTPKLFASNVSDVYLSKSNELCLLIKKTDDTLWGVGNSLCNSFGEKYPTSSNKPVKIFDDVDDVWCNGTYSAIRKNDGSVWLSGRFGLTEYDDFTNVMNGSKKIYADDNTLYILCDDNKMYQMGNSPIWGWGNGRPFDNTRLSEPEVIHEGVTNFFVTNSNIYYSDINHKLWGFGLNKMGQLGNGTFTDKYEEELIGENIEFISGTEHTLAIGVNGEVLSWGKNDNGQLGNGSVCKEIPYVIEPRQVLRGIKNCVAGNKHVLALDEDGNVWAWGANNNGQLADDNYSRFEEYVNKPKIVVSDARYIDAYGDHTLIIGNDDYLNLAGEIGPLISTYVIRSNQRIKQAEAQADMTVMLTMSNKIRTLGRDENNDEKITEFDGSNIAKIGSYGYSSYFLKEDGILYGWGNTGSGQLGQYDPFQIDKPLKQMTNVKDFAPGRWHILVLKSDGTVWARGSNENGQLGVKNVKGTKREIMLNMTKSYVKIQDNVKAVFAGYESSFAIKNDNSLWLWGLNPTKYKKTGSDNNWKAVKIADNVKAVTANEYAIYIVKLDGSLWVTGTNECGLLGLGEKRGEPTPTEVKFN